MWVVIKGLKNARGRNQIVDAVPVYSIREVKKMPTGKVSGSIIAQVIKKPDKINKFMNIMIEDTEKDQIQCCFFGSVA